MAIWLTENRKVIVQGITGAEGTKHTRRMVAAGTNVVGGVNARKAGTDVDGIPVFASVAEAMEQTGADVSVVFVPPPFAKDAVIEAIDAEIPLLVVITEGIPVHDTTEFFAYAREDGHEPDHRARTAPASSPGKSQRRHHPGRHHPGRADRAGQQVRHADLPDDVRAARLRLLDLRRHRRRPGHRHARTSTALDAFEADPETDAIVMIGEIGGDAEERAAALIESTSPSRSSATSPGFTAPEGKTMGHAGAIVSGSSGTAQAKKEALEKAGVRVGKTPSETARLMKEIMRNR